MSEPSVNFHVQARLTAFRIPTELIRKNFKNIQKLLEKQKKLVSEEVAKINASPYSREEKLQMIRKIIKSFEAFRVKLEQTVKRDEELRSRLLARLENLQQLANFTIHEKGGKSHTLDLHNNDLINWYRDQCNLLIVDYLIKSNTHTDFNVGSKLLLSFKLDLSKQIDYDLFENFNKVFTSIVQGHDLSMVTAWFNENKSALKKISSNLEFEISYCRFLSLIQDGDVNGAINFSRDNLSAYGNRAKYLGAEVENYEKNYVKLKEIGGLLVYISIREQPSGLRGLYSSGILENSPRYHEYETLLSNDRWKSLSNCFTENFNKIYGVSKNYPLLVYLSAGLSSLKTKSCYNNTENTIFHHDHTHHEDIYGKDLAVLTDRKFRGPNYYYKLLNKINHCPVCSPELYTISRNLPYAQLITHIFDNPYKLPNGNIYPFDKLLSPSDKYLSEKNTLLRMNKVKDPLTREIFLIDSCVRVYPA